jgi:hypothetical protein
MNGAAEERENESASSTHMGRLPGKHTGPPVHRRVDYSGASATRATRRERVGGQAERRTDSGEGSATYGATANTYSDSATFGTTTSAGDGSHVEVVVHVVAPHGPSHIMLIMGQLLDAIANGTANTQMRTRIITMAVRSPLIPGRTHGPKFALKTPFGVDF